MALGEGRMSTGLPSIVVTGSSTSSPGPLPAPLTPRLGCLRAGSCGPSWGDLLFWRLRLVWGVWLPCFLGLGGYEVKPNPLETPETSGEENTTFSHLVNRLGSGGGGGGGRQGLRREEG